MRPRTFSLQDGDREVFEGLSKGKYQVTELVQVEVASDDPFAGTGFYDGSEVQQVRTRDEFHLGIFPVPQGIWDKHILSVLTLVGPPWAIFGLAALRNRRRSR
jgi:hypothetical protein